MLCIVLLRAISLLPWGLEHPVETLACWVLTKWSCQEREPFQLSNPKIKSPPPPPPKLRITFPLQQVLSTYISQKLQLYVDETLYKCLSSIFVLQECWQITQREVGKSICDWNSIQISSQLISSLDSPSRFFVSAYTGIVYIHTCTYIHVLPFRCRMKVISRSEGLYMIYTPRAGGPRLCKSHRDRHRVI